jgi:hypothetical protein
VPTVLIHSFSSALKLMAAHVLWSAASIDLSAFTTEPQAFAPANYSEPCYRNAARAPHARPTHHTNELQSRQLRPSSKSLGTPLPPPAVQVAQLHGVTPKAIRDIWHGHSWGGVTANLWVRGRHALFPPHFEPATYPARAQLHALPAETGRATPLEPSPGEAFLPVWV